VSEVRVIGRHAGSVLAGQLASMAFGVADTLIAGRFSDTALAALSVGSAIYVSVFVSLIGIVQGLLPIWAEMLGAGQTDALGRSLRQSLYLCAFVTLVAMGLLLFSGPLLRWTQVPAQMRSEVEHYLFILAFAFAPALLFRLYSAFNQALGKPLLVTWLQIAALCIKVPLSLWLVAGGFGVSGMGAAGCAWATLVVNYLLLALALWMLRRQQVYAAFALWRRPERPDWREIAKFARLGVPVGLSYFVEVTSFTLMALFIARLGTTASASHQIAASLAAVLYMAPLSLAIACSARVSFWLGKGHARAARQALVAGMGLAWTSAIALATCIYVFRFFLVGLYSANPHTMAMAATLLTWVALYHLADATQAMCGFLLRCYRVTVLPLVLYAVLLWGVGLYGGYTAAYGGPNGGSRAAASFWSSSTLAIALVAVSLLALLWREANLCTAGKAQG
jgi:multidrug resistance protein, MATE family